MALVSLTTINNGDTSDATIAMANWNACKDAIEALTISDITDITATAAELNKMSGVTSTAAELNYVDVTAGTATANKALVLDSNKAIETITTLGVTTLKIGGTAITSTANELNILDGVTASAAELNVLDGVTSTVTELNYTDGVTSGIQTQLNAKQATITGAATTIDTEDLTASRALQSSATGKVEVSAVTATELSYLSGVTSAIQTQIDNTVGSLADLGVTASAAELNIMDGATLNTTELNYVDGVTSALQTQLDAKTDGTGSVSAISWAGNSSTQSIAVGFTPTICVIQLRGGTTDYFTGILTTGSSPKISGCTQNGGWGFSVTINGSNLDLVNDEANTSGRTYYALCSN